mgnify:CR=1 FL=1
MIGRLGPACTEPDRHRTAADLRGVCRERVRVRGAPSPQIAFGMVPLSALAAASLRLIPLYERLVLWAVPAVTVGIALVFDRAAQLVAMRVGDATGRADAGRGRARRRTVRVRSTYIRRLQQPRALT